MALNDIKVPKENAQGTFNEIALAPADIGAAPASHTHAAADITSGVLDFDRIQQVLEVESDGTEGTPTEVDLTTNIVGGNLHALVVLLGADSNAFSKVVLPALGAAATGKVTVRVNEFEDASDDFVQIVLDDDTAIFPASGYTEMDPDEEFTFRWNDGRWDMDLRPNPSATTAVSIFKPNASGTLALTSLLGTPVEYVIACSDETTNLTTGTAKVTFRAPVAFKLTGVAASVNTAPTDADIEVDINNGANSALSTLLSIDDGEKTSATATTAAVIDTDYDDFAADAEITIDIDQIGSTIAGKGLKVVLKGVRA